MGEYEELVELGFEGVDKIVEKYHDKAFDKFGKHSSAWHRRHDRQQQQREYPEPYVSELSYKDRATLRERDDRNLDSNMYAPDRWQGRDYQDRKETRHLLDETFYYRGPDAGTVVMRGSDPYNNTREYGVAQYQQSQYDSRRDDYGQRGRPAPRRRRSSWSPQRSGRDYSDSRRARSRSRSVEKTHRVAATVAGGLIGGLLGNQLQKGKKYDTTATIAGAVIGGLSAREVAEQWDKRRARREDCDEKWEAKYGDDRERRREDRERRRDDRERRRDDRYDDRDSSRRRYQDRDW